MRDMIKPSFLAGSAVALVAAISGGAIADPGRPVTPGFALACGADYQQLCAGVGSDERVLLSCVSRQYTIVRPRCQGYILIRYAAESCAGDLQHYCHGVTPGGGRAVSCLMGNRDRLAPACIQALETGRRVLAGEGITPSEDGRK